ncbi:MAG TPA: HAMP domain-containing sensor histidine kinase, partial [Bryobacteraceae bacterium]|nr:HAMP domain-containing sensor histidine kinase [Bryobacteraceae bacterium]
RTELCRLGDVVCAAYEPLRSLAESARVNVQISIPDDLEVPLARARMERVFANLITNSVQAFKSGGGEIRISAKAHESYAQVDILDTGPGVSAEVRARLFEPFVSDGKKNGLGLGLALSRQTVLSHGGDLWLVENSHEGAHFRMRLPLDSQQNVHNSPTTSSAVRL